VYDLHASKFFKHPRHPIPQKTNSSVGQSWVSTDRPHQQLSDLRIICQPLTIGRGLPWLLSQPQLKKPKTNEITKISFFWFGLPTQNFLCYISFDGICVEIIVALTIPVSFVGIVTLCSLRIGLCLPNNI